MVEQDETMDESDLSRCGYFFDFDGVLVNSVGIKTKAFESMFKQFGPEVLQRVLEHHRHHGGISRVDKIQYSHTHFVGEPLSEQELVRWTKHYSNLVLERVIEADWVAGAREFLEEVYRDSLVFVISGTPEDELVQVIRARGIEHYFTEILGSPTRKPEHIRNLLRQYDLSVNSCIFIGDALTDYDAARETGLHFIGIQGDMRLPDDALVLPDCTGLKAAIAEQAGCRVRS